MSDDDRVFIYDEAEVVDRAQRIAEIRDRRRNPWAYEEHQPFLKAMMEEAAKSDELRSKYPELSSLKLLDKR